MTAPTFAPPGAPKPNPGLFLQSLAQRLGLKPSDHQGHIFDIDGHRVLSMVVLVTSEMAARWLADYNAPETALHDQRPAGHPDLQPNRRLSPHVTSDYERSMSEGRWMVTPQNVFAFDTSGFLLDGQHRLRALELAAEGTDSGLWFRVEVGWPRESFAVIDSGNRRSAYQLLRRPYAMQLVGSLRILAAISGQALPPQLRPGDPFRAQADNDLLLSWMKEWEPYVTDMAPLADSVYRATGINKSTHGAILTMAAMTEHAPIIRGWVEGLTEGAGLAANDPRLLLRNRWGRDARALSVDTRARVLLIGKAWNAYAAGRTIGTLKAGPTEDAIQIVGFDYRRANRR